MPTGEANLLLLFHALLPRLFIAHHQPNLRPPRHMLNRILPAHCLFLRGKCFRIHQFHRQTALRILRAFSRIMSLYSFFQIVRPASVETTVPTLHNICIIHDFSFNWGHSKTSFYYVPNYTHSLSFCHIIACN